MKKHRSLDLPSRMPEAFFGKLKTIAMLSCSLAVLGAPVAVHAAGKKPTPPPPADYPYSILQLNMPAGADSIETGRLNESGSVAGEASFPNYEWQACIWDPNGNPILLPLLDNADVRRSSAGTMTDSGTLICGSSVIFVPSTAGLPYYDSFRAMYWEKINGTYVASSWNDLLPAELGVHLYRSQITSDGQFAAIQGPDTQTGINITVIARIVYAQANGRIEGIDILDVLPGTRPLDINSNGSGVLRVVGSTVGPSPIQSFMWKKEGANSPAVVTSSETISNLGMDVNADGQVVGTLSLGDYQSLALFWEDENSLWDVEAALIDMTFGGTEASARSINDFGEVVGVSTLAGRRAEQRAFIYVDNTMVDLNLLAPVGKMVMSHATRINNAGQILTLGKTGNAFGHYILTPTNAN